MSSNDDVDAWIAQLMQCKPLSEVEVKKLCEKVSHTSISKSYSEAMAWVFMRKGLGRYNGVEP
jgi:hypothetical protein